MNRLVFAFSSLCVSASLGGAAHAISFPKPTPAELKSLRSSVKQQAMSTSVYKSLAGKHPSVTMIVNTKGPQLPTISAFIYARGQGLPGMGSARVAIESNTFRLLKGVDNKFFASPAGGWKRAFNALVTK